MIDILPGIYKRDRDKYPYFKNYIYEHYLRHFYNFGVIYEKFLRAYKDNGKTKYKVI